MLRYASGRVLATVPVILVVALLVFSLLYVTPGDPAAVMAGDNASPPTSHGSAPSWVSTRVT